MGFSPKFIAPWTTVPRTVSARSHRVRGGGERPFAAAQSSRFKVHVLRFWTLDFRSYAPQFLTMKQIACAVSCALLFGVGAHSQTLTPATEIYDGFETKDLSNIWSTSKFEPGTVVMQSKVVRAGKSAV